MKRHKIPDGVGPHEGLEFELMRTGEKNVALFFELEPDGLDSILAEGFIMLQFAQFMHKGETYFTRIIFRNGFEIDAIRLKEIVTDNVKGIDQSREHEIGAILSYTPEQVDAFIRHAKGGINP